MNPSFTIPFIPRLSLIGLSLLNMVLKGVSLIASIPTHSLGPNERNSSRLTNPFTVNWFMSSLPLLSLGLLLTGGGEIGMKIALQNAAMVRDENRLLQFCSTIRDGEFTTRSMVARMIQDLRVRLAHRCIATTILGHEDSTQRITLKDLFFLYCIYSKRFACNIPFWLARYLSAVRDGDVVNRGMYMTQLARSFGILTWSMIGALSVATRPTQPQQQENAEEEDEGDDDGAGGNAEAYRGISRRDWRAYQTRLDQRSSWMYDHTVHQMQYLSMHDHLEPHMQIDPFPGRNTDYPRFGYTGPMPPGYDYRHDTTLNGSN
ncbi:hypothetical protein Tco_1213699 [Tanacetum coccineum]